MPRSEYELDESACWEKSSLSVQKEGLKLSAYLWHQQIQGVVQPGKCFGFKQPVLNCSLRILLNYLIISYPLKVSINET